MILIIIIKESMSMNNLRKTYELSIKLPVFKNEEARSIELFNTFIAEISSLL